ncbi:M20 family metallopeptidase [Aurantimicrobium minutum]|uniref:M20 family metallopeptidase n=1 Tax=Aurantimicrobium minutum TaxID=708131 RepID=UPI0024772058|nr:M20/M25/M40 family metallo-hydrolase [Aurantimicrobium minutum]MDH6423678.1 acetylornithine deacetylase [Aurantimicrobium minutum]
MSVEQEAVELLTQLVGIDSVNPGLVAGAVGEEEIVNFLAARLEAQGFTIHIVPSQGAPDRPSLVAVGPGEGATVVFNGHLDTVGVKGMDEPFTARVDGDKLFARGAADMKGGVAALVVAAEHLARSTSSYRPVLALVADEEDASMGSEAVIAALPDIGLAPELCVIAEPTGLDLAVSLRGFAVVRARFTGRASHSSQPELGINAVTQLGHLLAAVENKAQEIRATGGDLMVTMVRGGDSPFVIPDEAECIIELRTVPGVRADQAVELVHTLGDSSWNWNLELVASREAWQLQSEGPAADLAQALASELGTGLNFVAPYWMEATLWEEVCPTLICGPTGGGLHAIDEWVDLQQVRSLTSALIKLLA